MGVLLTTLLVAETAPAAANGDHPAPVASKRTSHQLPNFRKGIKNEFNRYFGRPEGGKLSWFKTFRESGSRFKNFVAASATRWTFAEQRAELKESGFTAMSTKAMDSGPGEAWILVDGRYKGYEIFRVNGEPTYYLYREQRIDKGKPLWAPKVDVNVSPGEQSEPVPDFSQPVIDEVLDQNGNFGQKENKWPPAGAAKYGMFLPAEVQFNTYKELTNQTWARVSKLALHLDGGDRMSVRGTNSKGDPFGFVMEPVRTQDGETGFVQIWDSRGLQRTGSPRKLQEVIAVYQGSKGVANSMLTVQRIKGAASVASQ